MDLTDFDSIVASAKEFKSKENELHLLINNAGVMATPYSETKNGYEIQWGTNVVGHFLLTKALYPSLKETSSKNPEGTVRVVNVSSYGHNLAPRGGINFGDTKLKTASTWTRYGQSKLGNILMSNEIARRYADSGIYALSVHPGSVATELLRGPKQSWGGFLTALMSPLLWLTYKFQLTPEQGAITQLYAATSPEVVQKKLNGKYFVPYCKEYEPSNYGKDPELAKKLWEYLEKETEGRA